jgi:predicted amidohydrolase
MKKLKLAAIQAESLAPSWQEKWQGADVAHALDLLDRAASKGADLACFPELYPLVGEELLCAKAAEHRMHIVAGLAAGSPTSWHNTSTIISAKGKIIGRQTKNYPTAIEIDRGVVPGKNFEVFLTDIGRFGIVICADFAFFNDGAEAMRAQNVDIIFNPAVWFALSGAYPHTVAGRHMEYSVPVVGVNLARPSKSRSDQQFPPAGGFSTVCVPPPIANLDELWEWFRSKPGGIDSTEGFIHTMGATEDILIVDIDIDAVRAFPGYFSTRKPERGQAAA